MSGRYVEIGYPWKAVIDRRSREPARFYATLIGQAMSYHVPARRRLGSLRAAASRQGIVPESLIARSLAALPTHRRPELDSLLERTASAWPELAPVARDLPSEPPPLAALALQRSAALTVFVFGEHGRPLLVLKVPAPGDDRADGEADALREAEPAGVSPRSLGRVGDARVQEALDGKPMRLEPLTPDRARRLRWSKRLAALAAGLARLGEATAKSKPAPELDAPIERAAGHARLTTRTRDLARASLADLSGLRLSVLRHGDASAQNCLFVGQRLSGLVDWESANFTGAPGFDVWNSAIAYLDHGVGLVRWSDDVVVETFAAAWRDSEFFRGARGAARTAARAAGVPDSRLDSLEVAFFASRLGRRLAEPGRFPTGPAVMARMLELVCADS